MELDGISGVVCVPAAICWGVLQEELEGTSWGLLRSALYPARATLGELLAASWPGQPAQHAGDLRQSVVGLEATYGEPARCYRYTVAPRKASGPDLRYMFIGANDVYGRIERVSLQLWARVPGALIELEARGPAEASEALAALEAAGLRPSWSWWAGGVLEVACHAPAPLLAAQRSALDALRWRDEASMTARRREIEASMAWEGRAWRRWCLRAEVGEAWEEGVTGIGWDTHHAWLYGIDEEGRDEG